MELKDGNGSHLRRQHQKLNRKRNQIYTYRGDGNSHRTTTIPVAICQLVLQISPSHRVDKKIQKEDRPRRNGVRMIPIKVLQHEILFEALETSELKQAELVIFQLIQKEQLGNIYDDVAGGKDFPEKHTLAKLSPKWDSSSRLIRVPGRMEHP